MGCPYPMGRGWSSYAWSRYLVGTNLWRGTEVIIPRIFSSLTPRASISSTSCCRASKYASSSGVGMLAVRDEVMVLAGVAEQATSMKIKKIIAIRVFIWHIPPSPYEKTHSSLSYHVDSENQL